MDLFQQLAAAVRSDPFNLIATLIFLCAILHTFLASSFMGVSHRLHNARKQLANPDSRKGVRLHFFSTLFHFLGEVEVVFGLWMVPLLIAMAWFRGWEGTMNYIDQVQYGEPIFVAAIMIVAASKPILRLAESLLSRVAGLGRGTPMAWWLTLLSVGPLLGSLITEPAAMTICALLLGERFYRLQPDFTLRYATLGLLFVNISVGGILTHFAAPPVVMVASRWNWDLAFMAGNFGWKAVVGILLSNLVYLAVFSRQLRALRDPETGVEEKEKRIPPGVTLIHLGFIVWLVLTAHHTALVVFAVLFYIAFTVATEVFQDRLALRGPLLVGFFLAGLVTHGGCQKWWIVPVLSGLGEWPLMLGATGLTAFNDNAAITYLASLVPNLSDALKYAVVAGAVTGGGLTVIANAPNPAGQSILQKHFGENGVSPLGLFLGALVPTIVVGACLMCL